VLHERDASRVALAQGVTHVTPAGEFQPRDLSTVATSTDLNIWNNMIREYAEEFLGLDHASGQPIDTRESKQFRTVINLLTRAYQGDLVTVRFLGIGLDPLTWKPEILMVAIFDEDVFDRAFAKIVRTNSEGRMVFSDDRRRAGIAFTEENVRHRVEGRMLAAGRSCLRLAWHHRVELGLV
jgi:hypothetical protein